VIATGFQTRAQEQPSTPGSRGAARGREGQMALPMSAAAAAAAGVPVARGGHAPAPSYAAEAPTETINLDDFYMNLEQIPAAPVAGGPGAGAAALPPEWTPAERPIIRPQVSGGPGAPPPRRSAAQVAAARPSDELGVEESELDKPTYLRRGLFAPE
jgi:hypothetical protein